MHELLVSYLNGNIGLVREALHSDEGPTFSEFFDFYIDYDMQIARKEDLKLLVRRLTK